ncbi:MAG: choice-of-anchor J domain-containing protein [Flavobacteriales bacterium]|nr:choice-of-anchor J domain-containing protein [Flavobacteriales bacterium]
MKKTLLFVFGLSMTFGLSAQVLLAEDFQTGTTFPSGWTITDVDGLAPATAVAWCTSAWTSRDDFGDATNQVAGSVSWYTPAGTSDDWMITPALTITDANTSLTWRSMAQDPAYPDGYEVRVSTSGTAANTTTFSDVLYSTGADATTWGNHNASLASYVGQTIHIAFRNNSNDMFALMVDDIYVKVFQADDISITDISSASFVMPGTNVTIAGTIVNGGANTVTSVDVTWDDGTGPYSQTFSGLSIATGGSYNFSHGTQLNVASAIAYNLSVNVAITGVTDLNMSDNSMDHTVAGLTHVPNRSVVIEEGTGSWCGWCPRGAVAMEALYNDGSRPNFIGIAVHNGDPMTVAAYDAGAAFTGFPGMNVNRKLLGESVSTGDMQNAYDSEVTQLTNAEIAVVATYDWGVLKVDVTATFAATTNTEHRLAAILVEDNVTGTSAGYDQTNYYDGGTSGALSGGGIADWTTAGDPVPAADMTYGHVGRVLFGGYDGDLGSITLPALAGTSQSKGWVYSLTTPDFTNFKVVGVIINSRTGEIMNAATSSIAVGVEEESIVNSFSVYLNPATSNTNITFELSEVSDVNISVVNMMGQSVYNEAKSNVSGAQRVSLDANSMASGMYFVNLTINGETVTKKLSITK